MRVLVLSFVFLLLGLLTREGSADDEAPAPADDDFDIEFDGDDDDFEDEPAEVPGMATYGGMPTEDTEPVDDFDEDISEGERKKRMISCFTHTTNRAKSRREEVTKVVGEMTQQHQMTQQQALNSVFFSWMMTCYMNIDADMPEAKEESAMDEHTEQHLFSVPQGPQSVQKASKRQWSLLESVLVEQQATGDPRLNQGGGGASQQQARRAPAEPPPGGANYLYLLGVLGVFFGVCALLVMKLKSYETSNEKVKKEKKDKKKR